MARVKYVLTTLNIGFQQIIVNLEEVPFWHRKINKGEIPIMETPDGQVFTNSAEITKYALKTASENSLGGLELLPP